MGKKIYSAITKIMAAVGPIGKDAENPNHHYKYRSAEAVYNRVQPLFAKYGVFTAPQVLEEHHETGRSKAGETMHWARLRVRYTFFSDDGSSVDVVVSGEGMDVGDKATAKALTVAHRYAICQLLNLPFEAVDPEQHSPEWADSVLGRITLQQLNELKNEWMESVCADAQASKADKARMFREWACTVLDEWFDATDWRQWKDEDLDKCRAAIAAAKAKGEEQCKS